MREKLLIPAQFLGLGDVIFSMTLVRKLAVPKYKVLWPVLDHFVEGCQRAYPDITFIPKEWCPVDFNSKNDTENELYRYLPIRWSDGWKGLPYTENMRSKYDMYDMDFTQWKQLAHYRRDLDREEKLAEIVGVKKGERFNLVNKFFGSNSQFQCDIQIKNEYKNIEISTLKGFSLFDWSGLIEDAAEIHVANSSILYLLEMLDWKAKEVHLYCRKPIEKDFSFTDYLHTKPYILHY